MHLLRQQAHPTSSYNSCQNFELISAVSDELRLPKADTMAPTYVSTGIYSNMTYFCTSITLELIGTFFLSFEIRNNIRDCVIFPRYTMHASVM